MEKTNVMRILEKHQITYQVYELPYTPHKSLDSERIPKELSLDGIFKTIVTVGASHHYYVFVIPFLKEINLKKAARVVSEKSVTLVPVTTLPKLTGYIRGGCSFIGMPKWYPTWIDCSALACGEMIFSAGKVGYQVGVKPTDLVKIVPVDFADLV